MFACICRAVTEDQVCAAIDEGATTTDAVAEATRAGTGCGGCRDYIEDMIEERCHSCPVAALRVA
ncbi:MAG TPA: (2Fe-2S)-binding protein [Streptosporangiaceae bacterium]